MVSPEEEKTYLQKQGIFTPWYVGESGTGFGLFRITVEKKVFPDSGKNVRKPGDF
jgi:hypothetical protein